MAQANGPLTINGVHLNERGDEQIARVIDAALFGPRPAETADMKKLRAAILEKNLQFFYDYRAVNGCYIYGGRKAPFGVVNFPPEFAKLRKMIANRDRRVWAIAAGQSVPDTIDDSDTGELPAIETNVPEDVKITSPEESQATFKLAEGYQANLFASEVQFPDLKNPVAMSFDGRGRLWVCTMPTYPMYLPGTPVHDKLLIFEDSDGDGRADKQTIFADGLHLPTGFELGDGGVYVGQEPTVVFLRDTDGDDHADTGEVILSGFDSADSHHAVHAFTWDPGGALHWQEGIFHFSQVETASGPQRVHDAGVFRFEPRTGKLDVFVDYPFANPWGHYIDRWGQNIVADASGAPTISAPRSADRPTIRTNMAISKNSSPSSGAPRPVANWSPAAIFPTTPKATTCSTTASAFRVCCNIGSTTTARASPPNRSSRCSSRAIVTSGRSTSSSGPTERSTWSIGSIRWSATCSIRCAIPNAT